MRKHIKHHIADPDVIPFFLTQSSVMASFLSLVEMKILFIILNKIMFIITLPVGSPVAQTLLPPDPHFHVQYCPHPRAHHVLGQSHSPFMQTPLSPHRLATSIQAPSNLFATRIGSLFITVSNLPGAPVWLSQLNMPLLISGT